MRSWRTISGVLIASAVVLACAVYEGRDRPIWQEELPCDLFYVGTCDDDRQLAVVEVRPDSPMLAKYELVTGKLVSREELPPSLAIGNLGKMSRDGDWLWLREPNAKIIFLEV